MAANKTMNGAKAADKEEKLPGLLQFWIRLHRSLPVVRIGTFDISLTLATIALLTSLKLLMDQVLIGVFGWPSDNMVTKEASASLVAIFHSLNLVPALVAAFSSRAYNPSETADDSLWQQAVIALLQFCTGYMVYDGILNIIILKYPQGLSGSDYMFLGHHIATTLYMTSTRMVRSGHQSAMMCMLLGECTNPLHNSFYVADFAQQVDCCNGAFTQAAHSKIELWFALAYCPVRAILGPVVCFHMTIVLWWRRTSPAWLVAIWTFLIWAVILGSIPWILDCWKVIERNFGMGGEKEEL